MAAATNASISTHGSSLASVSVAAWAAVASSTPAVNGRHLLNRWYDQFPPQQSPSLVVARLPAVRVRALYQRRRARVRRKKISVTYATFERQALCLSPHNDCRGHFPAEGSITCADAPLARRLRQVRSTDQGLTRLVPGAPRPPTGDPNTREMHRNLPAGQIAVRLPARSRGDRAADRPPPDRSMCSGTAHRRVHISRERRRRAARANAPMGVCEIPKPRRRRAHLHYGSSELDTLGGGGHGERSFWTRAGGGDRARTTCRSALNATARGGMGARE